MIDPLLDEEVESDRPRHRFVLDETGFDEAPKKYRRFYRRWGGATDMLALNEVLCRFARWSFARLGSFARVTASIACPVCPASLLRGELMGSWKRPFAMRERGRQYAQLPVPMAA